MLVLKQDNGEEITDLPNILKAQHSFYQKLFMSDANIHFECDSSDIPQITEEEKSALDQDISLEELTIALRTTKRGISAGQDGLSYEFYIMFWNKLGPLLHKAILFCLKNKKLYNSAQRGLLVTIPKKGKDPKFFKHLRLIMLLNSEFKLIEKVIANRIKPLLEKIIHEDQSGFLPGRKISANIRCIFDLMEHLNKEQQEGMLISVYYEKCFDRIEKDSLLGAMKMFNFGQGIISWVNTMYTGSTLKVLNNGFLTDEIKLTRGCRQGTPGSLYYFLICAELLAIKLRKNQNITGFELNSFWKLFGQYADDMDLYCKSNQKNLDEIQHTLSTFCRISGCKINYDKTTIYRIGADNSSLAQIYTHGMHIAKSEINVLGVWVTENPRDIINLNYEPLIGKLKVY